TSPGIFKNAFRLIRLEPLIVSLFKLRHSARSTSRFLLLSIHDPLFSKLSHYKLG
ncbi:20099_t:CDS:1, partial [Funneliformis geosporum]